MNTTRPWNTRSVKIGPYRPYDSSSSPSGSRNIRRVRRALRFVSPGGNGTDAARSARRSLVSRAIGFVETGRGPVSDLGARYLRRPTFIPRVWAGQELLGVLSWVASPPGVRS